MPVRYYSFLKETDILVMIFVTPPFYNNDDDDDDVDDDNEADDECTYIRYPFRVNTLFKYLLLAKLKMLMRMTQFFN